VRILLVDNFDLFRSFVYSILLTGLGFQVIAEASDGLEAVQKAEELKPDVILLDIDLPKLSGIEVARLIHQSSALSKIVFVTQLTTPGLLREALAAGGHGYVIKSRALQELLPAIEAVLDGECFVSTALVSGPADA
jgi:two-component system nitrate/nitrite response regulator NarL